MSTADYIQKVGIFRDLSHLEIEALFKGATMRQCMARTVFFTPDDSSEHLFFLKTGSVEIYRLTAGGKRIITQRIEPGTVFGEMGLLGQTLQGCFAEATQDSLVCVAMREDVVHVLKQRPDVALRLLKTVGDRLKLLEERLEQVAFSPVKVRLVRFLLAHLDGATMLVSGYTHSDIGDTIGALRQTVTEILNQMEAAGLVEVGHKHIRVRKLEELEAVAAYDETEAS